MLNKTVAAAFGIAFAISSSAFSQAASVERISFRIEGQPLRSALREFATQARVQILGRDEEVSVEGLYAHRVEGQLSRDEALATMLSNSGLQYEFINDRTVRLLPPGEERRQVTGSRGVRLAQYAGEGARSDVAKQSSAESVQQAEPPRRRIDLPEILVQGSRSLNMSIKRSRDDAQPYVVFDRKTIERSGAGSVEEFLKNNLTMNTNAASQGQQASVFGNSSRINLRGLGASQTLILIDGHRVGSAGVSGVPTQPDINGIPLSAIERIEILPTTASGIHGGSATGGVINVVLRRDYSGLEAAVTYGSDLRSDAANRRVELSAGFNFGSRTSVLLSGSYFESSHLAVDDREFVQRARTHMLENDPASIYGARTPPLGATTNVCSTASATSTTCSATPLSLKPQYGGATLPSSITFVPEGWRGIELDGAAPLLANAGKYNLDVANTAQSSGGGRQDLVNAPRIESANLSVRHQLTSTVELFTDLAASNTSSYFRYNGAGGSFTIPASAPNNPFNQNIRVTTPVFGADSDIVSTNYDRRVIGGLIISLPGAWKGEIDHTWNRVRFYSSLPTELAPAGAASVSAGVIDVLRDTRLDPVDFSAFLREQTISGPAYTTLNDTTLRLAGPVAAVPAGNLTLALSFGYRDEKFGDFYQLGATSQVLNPARSQSVASAYVEATLPLFSARNRRPGIEMLDLQMAARRDWYTVRGVTSTINLLAPTPVVPVRVRAELSSTDPMVGLRYVPVSGLMLRASYGTGFLPPAVNQLVPNTPQTITGATAALLGLRDPQRNEALGPFTLRTGGNPSLQPEESESWSAGIVLTSFREAVRLSVDWTRITKSNNITNFTLSQESIDSEAFVPGLLDRDDSGRIIGFNSTLLNIARAKAEALDLAFDYGFDTERFGRWTFSAAATHLLHLETQVTSASPVIENAGAISALGNQGGGLEWQANAALRWSRGAWAFGWSARFFDSYWLNTAHTINPIQGSAKVSSQIYHDVFGSYQFGSAGRAFSILGNMEVQIGIKNVFDKRPPLDLVGGAGVNPFGYSTWGDPRLASYYLTIKKTF